MNVSLSPTFEAYIQKQLDEGTYNNASELIREALRLKMQQDEIYHTKLQGLRAALIKGEESGIAEDYNIHDLQRELDSE